MNMGRFRGTEYHYTHPSLITENLYLSAARAITSSVLLDLGITSLINATLEMPCMAYQKQECIQIAVEDRICSKLYVYFDLVADKIHSVSLSGGKILVYCRAGMSRSATLCIAYFIKYHDMNVSEAFEFVKERRPIIHPNIGFMRQLREYESKLHHSKGPLLSWTGASGRVLLSFAREEFTEGEAMNTPPGFEPPVSSLLKPDRATLLIAEVNSAESYVITPLREILFLPLAKTEFDLPPRARRTFASEPSRYIVSSYSQTTLLINHSMPDRVPCLLLCTCRPSLSERTHTGLVVRNPEVVGSLSEEFSVSVTPSSIKSRLSPHISFLPLTTTVQTILELNGLIIAHKNILSRFSKSRASVKTPGLKLSSGPSNPVKAKTSFGLEQSLTLCLHHDSPLRLENSTSFNNSPDIPCSQKKEAARRTLTLKYSLNINQIGELAGENLGDPPLISPQPTLREFPLYTLVTRKSILKTPLHTALILSSVKTAWFFDIQRASRSRSSKLNWAAERRSHEESSASEICAARPDIHYVHQTPRDSLPSPKFLPITTSPPDHHESPKILPRFLIQRYPTRTVTNICVSPLLQALRIRKELALEYTNLYCAPRVTPLLAPKAKAFNESSAKRLLQRRIAVNVTEVAVRKEFEDLMEIPSVKDASKFTSLIENVKKEGDLARLQIWFEVFKRFVIAGRPIHPFVALTELRPVPSKEEIPPLFECCDQLNQTEDGSSLAVQTTLVVDSALIQEPTVLKMNEVLYCPELNGRSEEDSLFEDGPSDEPSEPLIYCEGHNASHEDFKGIASTQQPIIYAEVSDGLAGYLNTHYLQRKPFSILTGFKVVAESSSIVSGIDVESEDELSSGKFKRERPYIRFCPSSAVESLDSISGPADTFWYFQLDTPTAAVVKAEDEERKRQRKALLQTKNVSDSRYQLFLPDPETVKRVEKKSVGFAETRPVPTQRLGSLVSYQRRPRSKSRARNNTTEEDPNAKALKDLDASFKESNLLLEKRRRPMDTVSPRTSAYYESSSTSSSISSLKGLLETAQKIIGGNSASSYSSPSSSLGTRPSRSSSVKYRHYKSPR